MTLPDRDSHIASAIRHLQQVVNTGYPHVKPSFERTSAR